MDRQNRHGAKPGGGGEASAQQREIDRKERLRQLAMEMVDLDKDPYMIRNHHGRIECKLCLTIHRDEADYLAHTQAKRHQQNLARRRAMDAARDAVAPQPVMVTKVTKSIKIGRPGYRVVKQRDPETGQRALLFEVDYPEIEEGMQPRHRFMSAYEQRIEAPDKDFQYIMFAAEPYETIGFKVPSLEVDKGEGRFWTNWDSTLKKFSLQVHFLTQEQAVAERERRMVGRAPPKKVAIVHDVRR